LNSKTPRAFLTLLRELFFRNRLLLKSRTIAQYLANKKNKDERISEHFRKFISLASIKKKFFVIFFSNLIFPKNWKAVVNGLFLELKILKKI